MRLNLWWPAVAVACFGVACGGSEDGDASEGEAGNSGSLLWMVSGDRSVRGYDRASDECAFDIPVPEEVEGEGLGADVYSFVAQDGWVVAGLGDGRILVVEPETGEMREARVDRNDDTYANLGHSSVAAGGGALYTETTEYEIVGGGGEPPGVVRLDASTLEETVRASSGMTEWTYVSDILYDDGVLWALRSDFDVVKLDATTLELLGTVSVGEDSDDPDGPRIPRGNGTMTQFGGTLWVMDMHSHGLVKVDKASLVADKVYDTEGYLGSTVNATYELTANDRNFFVLWNEPVNDAFWITRHDTSNGEILQTYTPVATDESSGSWHHMAVTGTKIYVTSHLESGGILEIDIGSGEVTHSNVDAWFPSGIALFQ